MIIKIFLKITYKTCILIIFLSNIAGNIFAQGPALPPGGGGTGPQIGVPLDSNAIFILIGAGLLYLVFHYRHFIMKKENLSE